MAAKSVTCPLCQKRIPTEGNALEVHYMAELTALQAASDQGPSAGPRLSTRRSDRSGSVQFDKAIEELRARRVSRVTGSNVGAAGSKTNGGAQEAHHPRCFMCGMTLPGEDLEAVNTHIDTCLGGGQPSSRIEESETMTTAQDGMETQSDFLEYTWAGETRIRATALSGSISQSSSGSAVSDSRTTAEVDEGDVNVDDDDTQQYGSSQYGERDLEMEMEEDDEEEEEVVQETEPRESGFNSHASPSMTESLVVQSLKARIRELEQSYSHDHGVSSVQGRSSGGGSRRSELKCLICMDGYKEPAASIVCWHVHCPYAPKNCVPSVKRSRFPRIYDEFTCDRVVLASRKAMFSVSKITLPSDL
ncbi:hypothetical protein BJ684DRAFT_15173 [Piptocephalis cylindrospora]|uniref:E3 ubiquitin-protein ligase RNF220 middle domain-containing protein n=1 Tax=Piptocephalis cylindrospora TaxID=1907219 RepID=A0A4P9Y864_9FUNG|nr:hypothetical protein BJ684DRAFT_15173 [Piptocephalis cylindrospora]|eukprot:RKP14501.1 hypothetical protein BJ684DRAFT_15173 [Piptocephalis cylindrospora]